MTLKEAYDCGAFARLRGFGEDMCPNFDDEDLRKAWQKGYHEAPAMNHFQRYMLEHRKGVR